MKKLFAVLTALVLLFACLPLGAMSVSAETPISGTTGDCTWTLVDGHLTISGKGKMADYGSFSSFTNVAPWATVFELVEVTIEEGVTYIGNYTFATCNDVKNIFIPASVTGIGDFAFDCTAIEVDENNPAYCSENGVLFDKNKSVLMYYPAAKTDTTYTVPAGVTTVSAYAFSECYALTSVTLPNSVTEIKWNAFEYCDSLRSITLSKNLKKIGDSAFRHCTSLTYIDIPASVTSIGDGAFYECDALAAIEVEEGNAYYSSDNGVLLADENTVLCQYPAAKTDTTYTIPAGVTYVWDSAFDGCESLRSVIIPDSVTYICDGAFSECVSLQTITIPDSVTDICDYAFYRCISLQTITIPDSVIDIGDGVFSHCIALREVTIPDSVTSIGEWVFSSCSSLTSITIPDSVTAIENHAFYQCSALTSVTLSAGLDTIGDSAFEYCDALKYVYYSGSESGRETIAIGNDNYALTDIQWRSTYFSYDGYGCKYENESVIILRCPTDLSGVVEIPVKIEGFPVVAIGEGAFAGATVLNGVVLGKYVIRVEKDAFSGCTALREVTIPEGITAIGEGAFASCDSLRNVYYGGSEEDWRYLQIGARNQALLDATVEYDYGVEEEKKDDKTDTDFPWIWVAVGGVVVIGAAVLLFLLLKKKKSE